MIMATIEYRKLFRANVCVMVKYKSLAQPKIEGATFSKNLSSTGLSVIIKERFKEGDGIVLEIFLSEKDKPIISKSKIVWQRLCTYIPKSQLRYYSTGIHFVQMSSQDAIKTSDFITDVLRRQKENEDKAIIDKIESLKF